MTEKRGGRWASPERQEDEKYQEKMREFFAPSTSQQQTPKNGAHRHPLKDDTAVMGPASPADTDNGYAVGHANGRLRGGLLGRPVPEAEEGTRKRELLTFAFLAAAVLFVLFLAFVGYKILFGGGDEGAQGGSSPSSQAVSVGGIEPQDTNLLFEKPFEKSDGSRSFEGPDGSYAVGLGEYEWEGTKELKGDVEEVVLEGRTAANFTTAVRLTHGEITTGVFGRAEPDKPMWHATFQRTTTGGEESTNGTYQAVDEGQVILEGAYFDRIVEDNPGDEPDVIVRTYVEGDPRKEGEDLTRYARTYRAPEGTLIPWMPGWEEPDPVPETTP